MALHTVYIPLECVARPVTAVVQPAALIGLGWGMGTALADRYTESQAVADQGILLTSPPAVYPDYDGKYLLAHCYPPITPNGFFLGNSTAVPIAFKIGSYITLLPAGATISSIRYGFGGLWYRQGDPTVTDPWGSWALGNTYEVAVGPGAWIPPSANIFLSTGLTNGDGSESLSFETATFSTNPNTGAAWTWAGAAACQFHWRFSFTSTPNIGLPSWRGGVAVARVIYNDTGVVGTTYTDDGSDGGGIYTGTVGPSGDAVLDIPVSLACPVSLSVGPDSGASAGCAETQTPGTDSGGSVGCGVSL